MPDSAGPDTTSEFVEVGDDSARARSVLLVEDDDAIRRGLQLLLRSHGFDVSAYPGATGLAGDPRALRCAFLVADLFMSPTDAIQLLAQLRDAGWRGKSVLISGSLDVAWKARGLAAGYDRVLPKPISETVLVRTLEELGGPPPSRQV